MGENLQNQDDLLCYGLTAVYSNHGTTWHKKAPYLMTLTIMFYFPLEKWLLSDAEDYSPIYWGLLSCKKAIFPSFREIKLCLNDITLDQKVLFSVFLCHNTVIAQQDL